MNCPNCHRQLDGQTNFCIYCGAPLGAASEKKMPKRKKLIRWIAVGLVCAIIVGLGGYMIAGRIKNQRVTPNMLDYLVSTTDDTAQLVAEYFDLYFNNCGLDLGIEDGADLSVEMELVENKILRESIYLGQIYRDYSRRNGWDSDKYEDYEELYEACCALIDFVDNYDYDDPHSTRITYDSLMKTYEKCLKRVS